MQKKLLMKAFLSSHFSFKYFLNSAVYYSPLVPAFRRTAPSPRNRLFNFFFIYLYLKNKSYKEDAIFDFDRSKEIFNSLFSFLDFLSLQILINSKVLTINELLKNCKNNYKRKL